MRTRATILSKCLYVLPLVGVLGWGLGQAAAADADRLGKPQLSDPQQNNGAPKDKASEEKPPINITAFGNRLIVTSDDPQALALVNEMVRLLTKTSGGEGDFEYIKLKNADATEAARVLDEAFNGTRPQNQNQRQNRFPFGGGNRFFQQFAQQAAAAPAEPVKERIRVVADPATNSLLVRASPLDMLTIRHLLEKALDQGEPSSNALPQAWTIGPLKNATAQDVRTIIMDVYREYANNLPTAQGRGGSNGFRQIAAVQGLNGQPNTHGKVTLSVSVDDRTNSLIVQCSSKMYENIKKLIEGLDQPGPHKTVRFVVTNVDPALIQEAVDAIQGRQTNNGRQGSGFPFGGGGFGRGSGMGFPPRTFGGFGGGFGGFRLPGT
jgi:type II secretory pathway component GspD/PulD (secretin)